MSASDVARVFRLLPSERLLWHGRPTPGVARDRIWIVVPVTTSVMLAISALFAILLGVAGIPGWQQSALVALYMGVFVVSSLLAPRYLLDPCEFAITDRRVLWRRGRSVRSMDRTALTFARVHWHRSVIGVGHVELVRAVPFGPLMRNQRLMLHDVQAPDRVLAIVRGVESTPERPSDASIALTDRLDPGETVQWGAGPEGHLLGWRDIATTAGGVVVIILGVRYGLAAGSVLMSLEEVGLPVGSGIWSLLFTATMLTFALLLAVGGALVWYGLVRARGEGRETEYVLTDRRVLIRRGRTELSLDRRRIFDVAESPTWWGDRGLRNVYFILDGPDGRALGDSGALTGLTPSRDLVPPILYELRDVQRIRDLLGTDGDRSSLRDAA